MKGINELDETTINMKLLAGDSFYNRGIGYIKPFTLREILNFGYKNYISYLGIFKLTLKDFNIKELPEDIELSIFDIILLSENEELINYLTEAICFFLGLNFEDLKYYKNIKRIVSTNSKNIIIDRDNFENLSLIIQLQNCIKNSEDINKNPKNEKAKQILNKIETGKEQIKKYKNKNDDTNNLTFEDIISAVSTKSNHYNKWNIWDLTYYQLIDEFGRLSLIDEYNANLRAMTSGMVDTKKIKIKHWATKIKN